MRATAHDHAARVLAVAEAAPERERADLIYIAQTWLKIAERDDSAANQPALTGTGPADDGTRPQYDAPAAAPLDPAAAARSVAELELPPPQPPW